MAANTTPVNPFLSIRTSDNAIVFNGINEIVFPTGTVYLNGRSLIITALGGVGAPGPPGSTGATGPAGPTYSAGTGIGISGTTISIDTSVTVDKTTAQALSNKTSYNKVAITAPATGSTLTILDGKTITVNKSLTFDGTDSTTMTFPSTSASVARTDAGQTFTGNQQINGLVGIEMTPVATLDITAPASKIGIQLVGTAPAGVSSGNGTSSSAALNITCATGGATSDSASNKTGGGGGSISLIGGIGGDNTGAGSGGIARGGNGGALALAGGLAGNSTAVTGTVKGGSGGGVTITTGTGGTSATAAGGAGGTLAIAGGAGGNTSANATGGAGGTININGGAGGVSTGGGSTGANGVVNIGTSGTSAVNMGSALTPTTFAGDYLTSNFTNAGSTGPQTINKRVGSVQFAATATSLVVTNSLVTATSIIMATVMTNDTTMKSVQAVPASGSFTLFADAAATGTTVVGFHVLN